MYFVGIIMIGILVLLALVGLVVSDKPSEELLLHAIYKLEQRLEQAVVDINKRFDSVWNEFELLKANQGNTTRIHCIIHSLLLFK